MTNDADSEFVEFVNKMKADVDVAFASFGPIRSLTGLFKEQSLDDIDLSDNAPLTADATLWKYETAELLDSMGAAESSSVSALAATAFDSSTPLVRGIAWRLLAEARATEDGETTVAPIIAAEFIRRFTSPTSSADRDQLTKNFLLAIAGMIAIFRSREFTRSLEECYIDAHGGIDANIIRSDLSMAGEFLDHSDYGRRLAALRVLAGAGSAAAGHSAAIARTMLADPEPEVRLAAIVAYTSINANTSDPECLRLLADIVLDETRPIRHRFAAYDGLFEVSGAAFKERPLTEASNVSKDRSRDNAITTDWPVPVDWKFVEKCRRAP